MNQTWQQISVWIVIAIALAVVIWSAISAWRAAARGECGHCCGCSTSKKPPAGAAAPAENAPQKPERIVFLPADALRNSARRK